MVNAILKPRAIPSRFRTKSTLRRFAYRGESRPEATPPPALSGSLAPISGQAALDGVLAIEPVFGAASPGRRRREGISAYGAALNRADRATRRPVRGPRRINVIV